MAAALSEDLDLPPEEIEEIVWALPEEYAETAEQIPDETLIFFDDYDDGSLDGWSAWWGYWEIPIDPDDPYPGLARRAISIPLNGDIRRRVEHLQELAQAYRIDGAINPCHWGCRQGTGARGLIEEGLKEVGVPVLNLEVDCIDPRNFAQGQLKTRLEAFVEMIESSG